MVIMVYCNRRFTLKRFLIVVIIVYIPAVLIVHRHGWLITCLERWPSNFLSLRISSEEWYDIEEWERPRLYYSDKYKVVVCGVPKCGSTVWRKLLLILENDVRAKVMEDIEHEDAFTEAKKHRFIWSKFFSPNDAVLVDHRLNSYYRIMTVRNPLQRIVSAYEDKMLLGRTAVDYYMNVSKSIHQRFGNTEDGLATFPEFVQHILSENRSLNLDIHWRPFHDICDPCKMKYHYIARLETFDEDLAAIAETLGIDENLLPKRNVIDGRRSGVVDEKYLKYFNQISTKTKWRLYEYYKLDYELFGYPDPTFV